MSNARNTNDIYPCEVLRDHSLFSLRRELHSPVEGQRLDHDLSEQHNEEELKPPLHVSFNPLGKPRFAYSGHLWSSHRSGRLSPAVI